MIQLTKDNTANPDVYSSGDGSDPVAAALTLNGTSIPATITASPVADLFVWANDDTGNIANYSNIQVGITGAGAGILWELSADGATNWGRPLPWQISMYPLLIRPFRFLPERQRLMMARSQQRTM